mmetsp:Transcript_18090/g.28837  ORF Transcript_18090/g.28837 Transcript_18090/m.28837 type:complete len:105 (-) Transcript_18090:2-316(-)
MGQKRISSVPSLVVTKFHRTPHSPQTSPERVQPIKFKSLLLLLSFKRVYFEDHLALQINKKISCTQANVSTLKDMHTKCKARITRMASAQITAVVTWTWKNKQS